jgi:hypothetical protein
MIFESYHGTSSGGKSDTSWTNTWELENRRHGVVLTGITSPPCPGAFLGKMSTWCCPVACAKLCKSNTTNMRWKFLAETQLARQGKSLCMGWNYDWNNSPKQTFSSLCINFEWNSSTNWTFLCSCSLLLCVGCRCRSSWICTTILTVCRVADSNR